MASRADEFDYSSERVPEAVLFVTADEPLLVFPSVAAAERYLEAIDVENGVYPAAYGPHGEPHRIGSDGSQVFIERIDGPDRPDELKALLLRCLGGRGRPADPAAPLDTLVAEAWAIESEFWREHDPFGERFGTRISFWSCAALLLVVAAALYVLVGWIL